MAPAADMFEMGVKVQVLKRGTMFAMRAREALRAVPRATPRSRRSRRPSAPQLEKNVFRAPLDEVWEQTRDVLPAPRPGAARAGRARPEAQDGAGLPLVSRAVVALGERRRADAARSTTRSGAARRWGRSTSGRRGRSWSSRRTGTVVDGRAEPAATARPCCRGVQAAAAAGRRRCRTDVVRRRRRWNATELDARLAGESDGRAGLRLRAAETETTAMDRTDVQYPAGDRRHRLPVPEGRRASARTGRTSSTASTPSADGPADALAPRRLLRRRPEAARHDLRRAAAASSTRSTSTRSSSASPPTTSRRPTPSQLLGLLVAARQALDDAGYGAGPRRSTATASA